MEINNLPGRTMSQTPSDPETFIAICPRFPEQALIIYCLLNTCWKQQFWYNPFLVADVDKQALKDSSQLCYPALCGQLPNKLQWVGS